MTTAPATRAPITTAPATRVRVATFNIRTALAPDGRHAWPFRVNALIRAVSDLDMDVDVLGLQEVTGLQRLSLNRRLSSFEIHGSGRSRCRRGEASPLLVRDGFADVLATKTRWFGPTPDQPGSRVPGSQFPRIATTCSLRNGQGVRFDTTNLHLDHRSEKARSTSVHQLLDWLDESVPQIIVGDFNANSSIWFCTLPTGERIHLCTQCKLRGHVPWIQWQGALGCHRPCALQQSFQRAERCGDRSRTRGQACE
ncbi:MAG: endonuclease/exonuclease/phosphatase family protein [Microthrixaceae bacterium]